MKTIIYKGRRIRLNHPIREIKGNKEYKVYVLNKKTGKINIVRFGDRKLSLKSHIPKRKKSYCARSKGIKSSKPDKLSPNYWSRKRWKC